MELKQNLKAIIASLNDDSAANPEYTRGQVELAMDLLGYTEETADALRDELTAAADAEMPSAGVGQMAAIDAAAIRLLADRLRNLGSDVPLSREDIVTAEGAAHAIEALLDALATANATIDLAEQGQRVERPYDEPTDHEYGAWETDALEDHAHDLLAVVRHRRATALNGDPR